MHMILKTIIRQIVIPILLLSFAMQAQGGRYAGAFLELGVGARGMAMGEAYVAVANDGSAFYWNPAGASTMIRSEVSGMYASLFKGLVRHFHVGFSRPLYGGAAVSINWIRLTVPDIPLYDSPLLSNPNSSYDTRVAEAGDDPYGFWTQYALTAAPRSFSDNNEDALFFTLAKSLKFDLDFGWQYFVIPITIPVGFNVKLIRQSLFENKGSGIGFDAGGMIKFGIDDLLDDSRLGKFSFGVALKDIADTKITWNTNSRHADEIRRSWHLGFSYLQPLSKISGQLLLAYSFRTKYETIHNFGVEYLYYNRLAIRFGLSDQQFTAGVGLHLSLFQIDYAFRSHELGGTHRINTSIQL